MTTHDLARVSVLYVPPGWSLDDVIDEINAMGRVELPSRWLSWLPHRRGSWQVLVCDGHPCHCPHADERPGSLPSLQRLRRWYLTKIERAVDFAADVFADPPPEHP